MNQQSEGDISALDEYKFTTWNSFTHIHMNNYIEYEDDI